MPALDNAVLEFLEEFQRLDAVVGNADADVRQRHACFDCLVESEALGGLQFAQSVLHGLIHHFANQTLVRGPLWVPLYLAVEFF